MIVVDRYANSFQSLSRATRPSEETGSSARDESKPLSAALSAASRALQAGFAEPSAVCAAHRAVKRRRPMQLPLSGFRPDLNESSHSPAKCRSIDDTCREKFNTAASLLLAVT